MLLHPGREEHHSAGGPRQGEHLPPAGKHAPPPPRPLWSSSCCCSTAGRRPLCDGDEGCCPDESLAERPEEQPEPEVEEVMKAEEECVDQLTPPPPLSPTSEQEDAEGVCVGPVDISGTPEIVDHLSQGLCECVLLCVFYCECVCYCHCYCECSVCVILCVL